MKDLKVSHGLFDDASGVIGGVSFEDFCAHGEEKRNL